MRTKRNSKYRRLMFSASEFRCTRSYFQFKFFVYGVKCSRESIKNITCPLISNIHLTLVFSIFCTFLVSDGWPFENNEQCLWKMFSLKQQGRKLRKIKNNLPIFDYINHTYDARKNTEFVLILLKRLLLL